jgi:hypothetical protein
MALRLIFCFTWRVGIATVTLKINTRHTALMETRHDVLRKKLLKTFLFARGRLDAIEVQHEEWCGNGASVIFADRYLVPWC